MKLNYKDRQLPFHHRESKYYILESKNSSDFYRMLLEFSHKKGPVPLKKIGFLKEEYKTYRYIYYSFSKIFKKSRCVDDMTEKNLYAQKIGKCWYIINKL